MASGDDDYGEAFKKAKLEHDQHGKVQQKPSVCRRKPMQIPRH